MTPGEPRLQKVLIATDGSRHAEAAAALAGDLAQAHEAGALVLQVIDPSDASEQERAAEAIARVEKILVERGVGFTSSTIDGSPVQVILDLAEQGDIDLIALGNRGLGALRRFFLGSVSDKVMHHASCAVLLGAAPEATDTALTLEHVLVATDGSEDSEAAAALAATLAVGHDAAVRVVSSIGPPPPSVPGLTLQPEVLDSLELGARDIAAATAKTIAAYGVDPETRVARGSAVGCILNEADAYDADLVALGRRGRDGMKRLLLGSTTSGVVHGLRTSVLLGVAR